MTESYYETQDIVVDAIVPEGAVITPESALALEPEELTKQTFTATDEPVTVTEEAAVVPEVEANANATALVAAPVKQSRLSLAFHRISCGLCLSPMKGGYPMDYHNLVVTPTDEDGPLLGEDDDLHHDDDNINGGFSTTVITEDYKEAHESSYVGASSSTEHHLSSLGESETKAESSEVTSSSSFIEEITIIENDKIQEEVIEQEIVLSKEAEAVVPEVEEIVEEVEKRVTVLEVQEPPKSPELHKKIRGVRPFAKLLRRTSSSSGQTSALPSNPTNSTPLARFGGRLAKIIRQNENHSKSDSSPVMQEIKKTNVITTSTSVVSDVTTTVIEEESFQQQLSSQDVQIDFHETVMSDDDEDDEETTFSTAMITEDTFEQYASPPFQPIVKRSSVVIDTATQPVAIPHQSPTTESWAQSPTLHHGDGSATTAGSGQSLTKPGRSSSVGSIAEARSEAGSAGSSEVNILSEKPTSAEGLSEGAGKPQKRRGSVLKKIGKIIKNNKEKNEEKKEKRLSLSRQGTMDGRF